VVMIFLLLWTVSGYKEKFNLSVPVLVHLILQMLLALLYCIVMNAFRGTIKFKLLCSAL
jgi:uncharacterized membrane protein YagU involved in acid resistance